LPDLTRSELDSHFVQLQKKCTHLQAFVKAPRSDLTYVYPEGADSQSFHGASIGKLFTTTLVHQLVMEGRLSLSTPLYELVPEYTLKRLFVYRGLDYRHLVTVDHLLTHTSGMADNFGDKGKKATQFMDLVLSEPERLWDPDSILEFCRENLDAVDVPGARYHYSDPGFVLLGKIIEAVTGKKFHQNLQERIFDPLGMTNSYFLFTPQRSARGPINKIELHGSDVSGYNSLSCDQAGGGVVSTPKDLDFFIRALFQGRLVERGLLQGMIDFPYKFRNGIYYGRGTMELRMEGLFFLLRGYPRLRGHIGILSTHLWYDEVNDISYVLNFGSDRHMKLSFQALIRLVNAYGRR
jgi:D-alanyl-D-alanine carboxypeptidase